MLLLWRIVAAPTAWQACGIRAKPLLFTFHRRLWHNCSSPAPEHKLSHTAANHRLQFRKTRLHGAGNDKRRERAGAPSPLLLWRNDQKVSRRYKYLAHRQPPKAEILLKIAAMNDAQRPSQASMRGGGGPLFKRLFSSAEHSNQHYSLARRVKAEGRVKRESAAASRKGRRGRGTSLPWSRGQMHQLSAT